MSYLYHQLKNGIRIVHKPDSSDIAYLGWIVNTGTRDENDLENGLAHFIEHMMFKGTKKRSMYQVINRMEEVGGEMNAFTTKEETCLYSIFLKKYYKRAFDLFHDIIFDSTYPEKEIEKEKDVIIDEINSYKDSPSDQIFDEFEKLIYPDHTLGNDIMGSPESVKSFTRRNIIEFIEKNYHPEEMIISSIGDIPFNKLIELCERTFSEVPLNKRTWVREKVNIYKRITSQLDKETYQTHCIMGCPVTDISQNRTNGLLLLSNVLGGHGMNSRLNLSLREKNGLSYNVESSFTPYSDTGTFNIYFGTDKENLNKSINIVYKELEKLRKKKLTQTQIHKTKTQLKGQIAILIENKESLLYNMGKSILINNTCDTLPEIHKKIDLISPELIWDLANEIFDKNHLSSLIYL